MHIYREAQLRRALAGDALSDLPPQLIMRKRFKDTQQFLRVQKLVKAV